MRSFAKLLEELGALSFTFRRDIVAPCRIGGLFVDISEEASITKVTVSAIIDLDKKVIKSAAHSCVAEHGTFYQGGGNCGFSL